MNRYLFWFVLIPFALIAFDPHPVSSFPVLGYREMAFFDESNKIDRKLLVWYPVSATTVGVPSDSPWDIFNVAVNAEAHDTFKKKPVIVLSHGYTGNPHQLSWLIRGLVHHGFIVIAIQHLDLIDGKAHLNHWKRPQDVSSIITRFSLDPFADRADLKKIGIAGFSLGGTTSIWIAGGRATKLNSLVPSKEFAAPEDYVRMDEALPTLNKEMMANGWRDGRVKAAFIMAPGWAWLFDEENLKKVLIPTYFIAAEADKVLVTKNNAGYFARNISRSLYQAIPGKANHYIFISALNDQQQKAADPKAELNFLFEEDVSIDRAWIQLQVIEEAVGFFSSIFNN